MTRFLGKSDQGDVYMEREEGREKNEEEKHRKRDGSKKRLRSEGSGLCAYVSTQAQNLQGAQQAGAPGKSQYCSSSPKAIRLVSELRLVTGAQCFLQFRPSTDGQSLPTPLSTGLIQKYLHRDLHKTYITTAK